MARRCSTRRATCRRRSPMAVPWSSAACSPRLGLEVGDPIRIGEADFVIRGVLEREPDRIGGYVSIGPRAMIHADRLASTETILPGSLVRYSYGFALPPGTNAEAVLARLRAEQSRSAVARPRHPRRPAPDHPLHRPAGELPHARRADLAADRRRRRGARDPELPRRQDHHDRDAESASARRAASCSASICCRSWCWPAAASCSAS